MWQPLIGVRVASYIYESNAPLRDTHGSAHIRTAGHPSIPSRLPVTEVRHKFYSAGIAMTGK